MTTPSLEKFAIAQSVSLFNKLNMTLKQKYIESHVLKYSTRSPCDKAVQSIKMHKLLR